MKLSLKLTLACLFVFYAQNTFAIAECDKYNSSYDRTYCFSKLFVESDNELNQVYKELRSKLNPESKKQLANVENEWIAYRNQQCETRPGTINVDCNYKVNRERSEYLRDRLRECKTGMCNQDLIGSKSW